MPSLQGSGSACQEPGRQSEGTAPLIGLTPHESGSPLTTGEGLNVLSKVLLLLGPTAERPSLSKGR